MLVPISWLKDFVDTKLPLKDLMWKMTEAGLTCESYKKVGDEIVLDVEVTANRPDWMSIIGVAREVAAIQGLKVKEPKIRDLPKKSANFPIDLVPDFELFERWTAIIIKDIEIKPSPKWLAERIKLLGHAPINNIIDITNYVMYELGIPMHAFDYDEISGQIMTVQKSKGGEDFTSVDEISYKLPKDVIIIKDDQRLIDLAGIKGGLNSGIKDSTKNVLLHVTIDNPALVRRSSLALGLRSDASAIYERGPDKGGVINTLARATNLILELAGGEIASDLTDLKKQEFGNWNLELGLEKMKKVLGIEIPVSEAIKILDRLNLSPQKTKTGIKCTVPTYRADLKIEEDLIEEVARIYGYNKFPKTLPEGRTANVKIPYYFDDSLHRKLKGYLASAGFSEVMTLSLLSRATLEKFGLNSEKTVKIQNPVSIEYEYMRPSLIPSLLQGILANREPKVQLFELDKVYPDENYKLAAVANGIEFRKFKGVIDAVLEKLNIENFEVEFETDKPYFHPSKSGTIKVGGETVGEFGEISPIVLSKFDIKEPVLSLELEVSVLEKLAKVKSFKPIPENPAQVEDLTLTFPPKTRIGKVIEGIRKQEARISNAELKDIYKDGYTFRIWYQDPKKTLTNKEVEEIRNKMLEVVKSKFGGTLKE